jgi:hypothetical protein
LPVTPDFVARCLNFFLDDSKKLADRTQEAPRYPIVLAVDDEDIDTCIGQGHVLPPQGTVDLVQVTFEYGIA